MGGGTVIAGLITISLNWRYIYWVATALIGACTLLVILTFPETEFQRTISPVISSRDIELEVTQSPRMKQDLGAARIEHFESAPSIDLPKRQSWAKSLSLMPGNYTEEPWLKLFIRPIILLVLPPILWATLAMAVTIGFVVAISSNFATAFATAYNFEPWQSGLCFIAAVLGALIGIFFGGHVSDAIADYFTKRNGGIREPEMRLPALMISVITAPLSLIFYGVGIGQKMHWMMATTGLGLRKSLSYNSTIIINLRMK